MIVIVTVMVLLLLAARMIVTMVLDICSLFCYFDPPAAAPTITFPHLQGPRTNMGAPLPLPSSLFC